MKMLVLILSLIGFTAVAQEPPMDAGANTPPPLLRKLHPQTPATSPHPRKKSAKKKAAGKKKHHKKRRQPGPASGFAFWNKS